MQCVARGSESICIYERFKPSRCVRNLASRKIGTVLIQINRPGPGPTSGSSKASPGSESASRNEPDSEGPTLLRHAQGYGYSNSDTLGSMGMLTKVVSKQKKTHRKLMFDRSLMISMQIYLRHVLKPHREFRAKYAHSTKAL